MYDVIMGRRVNRKKIILAVILVYVVEIVGIIAGVKYANKVISKKYVTELESIVSKIENEENQKKIQEERERKEIIQRHIEKTSKPLSEEQQNNILHIYRSDKKRVFLTFDDGPSESVTPLILDELKKENIKATFFTLGTNVKRHPEIVK